MNATIRPATPTNLPFILELLNDAILHTTAVYEDIIKDDNYIQKWWEQRHAEGKPILIAEAKGERLGYGSFGQFRPRYGYRYCVEHSVYVHKNYQGQGVGRQLLLALIERAKADSYKTMVAAIDGENKGSISFHLKNNL